MIQSFLSAYVTCCSQNTSIQHIFTQVSKGEKDPSVIFQLWYTFLHMPRFSSASTPTKGNKMAPVQVHMLTAVFLWCPTWGQGSHSLPIVVFCLFSDLLWKILLKMSKKRTENSSLGNHPKNKKKNLHLLIAQKVKLSEKLDSDMWNLSEVLESWLWRNIRITF
jgi:hypothetical protein